MNAGRNIFIGLLLINLSLPLDGLASLPLQLLMKDELGAGPVAIATSNALISLPIFVAWLPGLIRDRKRGGSVDRWFLTGGIASAILCYAWLATGAVSLSLMIFVALLATAALLLAKTAMQAIMSQAARQSHSEDQAGAFWNVVEVLPSLVSYAVGPWLLHSFKPSGLFIVCSGLACVGLVIGMTAIGRPTPLPADAAPITRLTVRALLLDPGYRIAILIIFLFTFSPGWQTPILFYLTQVIALGHEDYGRFWMFISLFTIVGCILYRWCARYASKAWLLRAATILMVVQSPLPLLVADAWSGYLIGAISGLFYGFGIAAYWSLLLRSIPNGLHGAGYMIAVLVSTLGVRGGDLVGSWMQVHYGYVLPFVVTTIATALIAPALRLRAKVPSIA